MLLEHYFDESGSFADTGNFCIAGYMILRENAVPMEIEWREIMESFGPEYFHAKECIPHAQGQFKGKSKHERDLLVRSLIKLIKKYTIEGIGYVFRKDHYHPANLKGDVYSDFAGKVAGGLQQRIPPGLKDVETAYIFEAGHKSEKQARRRALEALAGTKSTVSFETKTSAILLQAADLLAWQLRKFEADSFAKKRTQPRKDFQALLEHPHRFLYISIPKDKDYSVIYDELWPFERRPQFTNITRVGPAPSSNL